MRFLASIGALFLPWPAFSRAEFDLFNAGDSSGESEGRYGQRKLSGTINTVDHGMGSDIDPVDDPGMDERKGFGEGRLQIKFLGVNPPPIWGSPLCFDPRDDSEIPVFCSPLSKEKRGGREIHGD